MACLFVSPVCVRVGMKPVEIHPSIQSRKMSTEEKRLASLEDVSFILQCLHTSDTRFSNQDEPGIQAKQDSSTTYVLESGASDPNISASEDSSPDSKPTLPEGLTATDNSNYNNSNSGGVFVTKTSLYVAAVSPDAATLERDVHSSNETTPAISRSTEISNNSDDIRISNSEPTPCQPQDPTF